MFATPIWRKRTRWKITIEHQTSIQGRRPIGVCDVFLRDDERTQMGAHIHILARPSPTVLILDSQGTKQSPCLNALVFPCFRLLGFFNLHVAACIQQCSKHILFLTPHTSQALRNSLWCFRTTLQCVSFRHGLLLSCHFPIPSPKTPFLNSRLQRTRYAHGGRMSRMRPRHIHEPSLLKISTHGRVSLVHSISRVVGLQHFGYAVFKQESRTSAFRFMRSDCFVSGFQFARRKENFNLYKSLFAFSSANQPSHFGITPGV